MSPINIFKIFLGAKEMGTDRVIYPPIQKDGRIARNPAGRISPFRRA